MSNVQPPRPGRKYSQADIAAIPAAYPNFQMPGYAMRHDSDGTVSFVPWNEASYGGRMDPSRPQDMRTARTYSYDPDVAWDVPPIQKRTPQQRLESLANSWMEDVKK